MPKIKKLKIKGQRITPRILQGLLEQSTPFSTSEPIDLLVSFWSLPRVSNNNFD